MKSLTEYETKLDFLNEVESSIHEEIARLDMFNIDMQEFADFINDGIKWQTKKFVGIQFQEIQKMFTFCNNSHAKRLAEEE